ncbi:MAG: hypothetical protein D8M59_03785 [Planctomycetes bacterium]|nr:hypothetical protein [Planctomycetota bacterium]NOG53117.1 hypothetical protein [Planctomycetota bacterium]
MSLRDDDEYNDDPTDSRWMSDEDIRSEVAAILARGLLRLLQATARAGPAPDCPSQNPLESSPTCLDVGEHADPDRPTPLFAVSAAESAREEAMECMI